MTTLERGRDDSESHTILDDPPLEKRHRVDVRDGDLVIELGRVIPFIKDEYDEVKLLHLVIDPLITRAGLGSNVGRAASQSIRIPNLDSSPRIPALIALDKSLLAIPGLLKKFGSHGSISTLFIPDIKALEIAVEFFEMFRIPDEVKIAHPDLFPNHPRT